MGKEREFAEARQQLEGRILALQEYILVLERQSRDAQRAAHKAGTVRQSVLGLSEAMPEPPTFIPVARHESASEAIVLMATDWQWGEVVDLEAMDGVNCYNVEIARKRAERFLRMGWNLVR